MDEFESMTENLLGGPEGNSGSVSSGVELYQRPIKVGKGGGQILDGDEPWIVGGFAPGKYLNETHPTGHLGQDQKAPAGTPIYPIASGKVIRVGQDDGSKGGNRIHIEHEGGKVTSYYAHLQNVAGKVGDEVGPGTVIGTVGDTGNAKGRGAHLHFEVKVNGSNVDPEGIMGKAVGSLTGKVAMTAWMKLVKLAGRY